MTMTDVPDRIDLGIVIERRASASPWADTVWRPVEVIPGGPEAEAWRVLAQGEGWTRYYAGRRTVELFRKETEGYRRNLSMDQPRVWVVLRRGERDGAPVMAPFHATVCPYEAESYELSGDDIVEGVPMPSEVGAVVQAFVERYHVDEPFVKRQQKPKVQDHGRR